MILSYVAGLVLGFAAALFVPGGRVAACVVASLVAGVVTYALERGRRAGERHP